MLGVGNDVNSCGSPLFKCKAHLVLSPSACLWFPHPPACGHSSLLPPLLRIRRLLPTYHGGLIFKLGLVVLQIELHSPNYPSQLWRRARCPHLILPGAREDNGTEYLVALLARRSCGQQFPSPNPPWLLSMPRAPIRASQGMCIISAGFCHCGERGGAVIHPGQGLRHGKYTGIGVSKGGPSEAVLLSYIKMPSDATNPVAAADLLAQTHQVPIHLSPSRPRTIQGSHHPISFPCPGRTRTNAPGARLLAT